MTTTHADVRTDTPARWAKQLASHLGRKLTSEETPAGPQVMMDGEHGSARCLMDTTRPDVLRLEVEGSSPEAVDQLAHVVGSHLERFGQKAGLVVEWHTP